MFYLLNIRGIAKPRFTIACIYSASTYDLTDNQFRRIIERHPSCIKNAYVGNDNNVHIKNSFIDFSHETKSAFYMCYEICTDTCRFVNNKGMLCEGSHQGLISLARSGKVANCRWNNETNKLDCIDVHFNFDLYEYYKYIHEQYQEFIDKAMSIGQDMSFDYIIRDKKVILTCYKGSAKRVIIPSFVNVIEKSAFGDLESITFGRSVEIICQDALFHVSQDVVIPSNVLFLSRNSFGRRTEVKYNGSKTIVIG